MSKKKITRKKWKWIKIVILVCSLWMLFNIVEEFVYQWDYFHQVPVSEDWNLIVVNRWNEIPKDYSVTLSEWSNGQRVDSRIYPYLQDLFDAAEAEGIYLVLGEGYRTAEEQQKLFDDMIEEYKNTGYISWSAEWMAKEWVALPGMSEHQLGLAVDINADKIESTNYEAYAWLAANAHRYGFILRYPEGKQRITGTSHEPWHYRYVGVEAACEIYEQGICLEEYIE